MVVGFFENEVSDRSQKELGMPYAWAKVRIEVLRKRVGWLSAEQEVLMMGLLDEWYSKLEALQDRKVESENYEQLKQGLQKNIMGRIRDVLKDEQKEKLGKTF